MTDQEIIKGLIDHDNRITRQFFFAECRPLLTAIMHLVYSYPVNYDEMVSELYAYLMDNDCKKLRQFQFRSSIYQWMKVLATRFFISKRNTLMKSSSEKVLYEREYFDDGIDEATTISDKLDVDKLLQLMGNRRYADTIKNLILNDMEPEQYALQIGVTVDNLYNIKKRAMTALTRVAIKYYGHGR